MSWPAVRWERVRWQPREGFAGQSRRARASTPRDYSAAVVPSIADEPVPLSADLAADLDDATRALVAFDAGGSGEIAPFAAVLLRSESAASSQIEGLTSSARALAEAEIGEGDRRNAAMILANVRTMQAAIGLADRLDREAILAMHAALMAEQRVHRGGQWRSEQVWVGGAVHHPGGADYVAPVAARVPDLMSDLEQFIARDDVPPLVLAALAHAQFETIHPFTDGNGRTGRAVLQSILLATGVIRRVTVPVSAGLLANRERYFDALTAYRQGQIEPILRCVADAARDGTASGESLVASLRSVRTGWESVVSGRRGSASWEVVELLLRQPVVTARVLIGGLGVSAPTAQAALARLVADGILIESTGKRRNRVYRAPDVLDVLDAFAESLGRRA